MAGLYTKIVYDLRNCQDEEEVYRIFRQYKREYGLTFEQGRYLLAQLQTAEV